MMIKSSHVYLIIFLSIFCGASFIDVCSTCSARKIQEGVDISSEGDAIRVHPGTYYESIKINKNDISIVAFDPLNPPVVDGSDSNFSSLTATWTNVDYEHEGENPIWKTFYRWSRKQPSESTFNSYSGGISEDGIAFQVYEDDEFLRGYRNRNDPFYNSGGPYTSYEELNPSNDNGNLPWPDTRPPINVFGRFWYDENNTELYIWSKDSDHPSNHEYFIPVQYNLVDVEDYTGITFQNLVFKHSGGYSIRVYKSGNISIENCFFISNRFDVYIGMSTNVVVKNSFFQDKGFWKRYWYDDCKGTILWGGKIRIGTYFNHGTKTRNIQVFGNSFHSSYSFIHPNIGESFIHDNIFSHAMSVHVSGGSELDECCSKKIYHNIFHHVDDNSLGLSNVNEKAGPIYVYRNLWYSNVAMIKDGFSSKTQLGNLGDYSYIYQNTFVNGKLISHHPYEYPSYKRTVLRNNIFLLRHKTQEMYWVYYDKKIENDWSFFPSFVNGSDSDYNVFWRDPWDGWGEISRFRMESDETLQCYVDGEFKKMVNETGLDPNSKEIVPGLVNYENIRNEDVWKNSLDTFSNRDYRDIIREMVSEEKTFPEIFQDSFDEIMNYYRIAEDSPARNSGVDLDSSWPDIFENIDDGMNDIGFYEYGQSDYYRNNGDDDPPAPAIYDDGSIGLYKVVFVSFSIIMFVLF